MNEIVLSLYATNPGAWVSMGIVILSVLTSWALNYSSPHVRVFGTVLAGLGCLIVAAWFFLFIINSGVLEDPKPNQTPLDSAKPSFCLLYTSPSPRDATLSRMPSSA